MHLVSASWDNTVRIWNTTTGECLSVLEGHNKGVASVAYNPHGSQVVSAGEDGIVRIWDATTGECLQIIDNDKEFSHDNKDQIRSVTYSPDGSEIITAGLIRGIKICSTATGELIRKLKGQMGNTRSVQFKKDYISSNNLSIYDKAMQTQSWGDELYQLKK